jgi:hypothetical protein
MTKKSQDDKKGRDDKEKTGMTSTMTAPASKTPPLTQQPVNLDHFKGVAP